MSSQCQALYKYPQCIDRAIELAKKEGRIPTRAEVLREIRVWRKTERVALPVQETAGLINSSAQNQHEANLRANRLRTTDTAGDVLKDSAEATEEPTPTNGDNNTHDREKYLEQLDQWINWLGIIQEGLEQMPAPDDPEIRKRERRLSKTAHNIWLITDD
jgi:hypothetical protein